MRVLREVRRFMTTLPGGKEHGVVAVSGGADSVALVLALHELQPEMLAIAHINHGLRGAESDGDEAFVRELAARLKVSCQVKAVDVAKMAIGSNLEATARDVRYEFLAEVANEVGASWIATGHTADDQAETVLHRLIRGTGLQGLRGIQSIRKTFSRGLGDVGPLIESGIGGLTPPARQTTIVRPLITVTRLDVIEYLTALHQSYREDSSNSDPRFTRNRIRRELVPLLKTFNPDIVTALGQTASQAVEAFEVLESDADRLAGEVELPRAGARLILDATKLAATHPYRVRELLRLLWQREGWPISDMSADHWSRLVAVARGNLAAADFPEGIIARRVGRVVQIGYASP
jgi:tRNA(Ile)-lysidine synthase